MAETTDIQPDGQMLKAVDEHSGEKVSLCYHCRKCTNGCPLAFAMDIMPNQAMRMIQLGLWDELLQSKTIWICASCQTCTTRCPNDIDIAHVMDALRQLGQKRGVPAAEKNIVAFHEAFLDSVIHWREDFQGFLGPPCLQKSEGHMRIIAEPLVVGGLIPLPGQFEELEGA